MDEAKWYVVHTYSGYENKGFLRGHVLIIVEQ
ncbi:MAG: transcription termination/antitermination protein NusG, partial [Oscillospiraceae bacterium]